MTADFRQQKRVVAPINPRDPRWLHKPLATSANSVGQPITAEKEPMSALRQPRSLRIRAQTDASPDHQGTSEHAHKDGNGHIQHRQHPHLHQRQNPYYRLPPNLAGEN